MSGWLRLGAWLGVTCAAACAPSRAVPPTHRAPPRSTVAQEFMTPPPVPQYRLARIAPEEAPPQQAIVAGIRLQPRAETVSLADSAGHSLLESGRPVPKFAGSGFVFWSREGVYRASTFLGRLEPLAATPFAVFDVSFGPNFWLARSREGDRLAIDPRTGADVKLAPQGLLDIATAGDGRVVAALELGRAVVSTDAGANYREVQGEFTESLLALSRDPLGFVLESKQLLTLERDGKLVRRAAVTNVDVGGAYRDRRLAPLVRAHPRELERYAPLEQAIARGVNGAPGRALVALEASVCEVDLSTGKVVRQGPELLPGSPSCELRRVGGELLMMCNTTEELVILSKVESERPIVERSFKLKPLVRVAPDRLLVAGGCDAEPAPFSVCTRFASGEWKQLSMRPDPAVGQASASAMIMGMPELMARDYVPRADGGAVAIVSQLSGYVDLASGVGLHLKGPTEAVLRDSSNCWVDGAGALRCLTKTGAYAWDAKGDPEPQVFKFNWLLAAGRRGLGRDAQGRLFQTEDYGKNWLEVRGPPVRAESSADGKSCGDVGCTFEGWLRTGWEPVPPKQPEAATQIGLAARPPAALPTLTCRVEKPAMPVFFEWPSTAADNLEIAKTWVGGFGVERLPGYHQLVPLEAPALNMDGSSNAMHALLSTFTRRLRDPRDPDAENFEYGPLRFRYIDYFDPSARINTASVTVGELFRVARRAGASSIGFALEGGGPRPLIPVLAREPGRTAGFLAVLDNVRVWVNAGKVTLLTPWSDTGSSSSATLDRDGSLLLLMNNDSEGPHVWRHQQGAGVEVFGLPATPLRPTHSAPDALGTSAQGEIAVLRFPSSPNAPTSADPALAYVPGKPIETLAPWSSLRLATDPACADDAGYRVLLQPLSSWLNLVQGATAVPNDFGLVAAVRWSKERVCLEALEVSGDYIWREDQQSETRVLWNVVQKKASHLGIGAGYELREPMSCQLSPAR